MPTEPDNAKNPAIGEIPCEYCRARVVVRVTTTGKAYYRCKGDLELKACHRRVTMGQVESRALRQHLEGHDAALERDERAGDGSGDQPDEPQRRDEPGNERTGSAGGFGLGDW
jgi:hypothetical protein